MQSKTRVLGTFTLSMLSVSAILNLRGLPIMASTGMEAIFFYILAAVLFLIPSSLICAELATAFPNGLGIYTWVNAAFGKKTGFLAIWMEWINNTISFPATLAMIIATLAYVGFPKLASNHWYLFGAMMLVFWGCTLFNFLGVRITSKLNIIGALFGTILPGAFIIALGVYWVLSGHKLAWHHTAMHFIPPMHLESWVFFLAVLSGYSGMQVTAFHAKNVINPNKTFPRSIAIAVILIVILSIAATLSIDSVVPQTHINLLNGVIEGFAQFFDVFHLRWLTPILAALIAIGAIASLSAWVLGPARGMLAAAQAGLLPKIFIKQNKREMPIAILLVQGVVGTLLASVFLFVPSLKSAFWILIALTSQFTLLMYSLVFLSAAKLRFKRMQSKVTEPVFEAWRGWFGITIIVVLGLSACIGGVLLGLFPPKMLHIFNTGHYIELMLAIDGIILGVPIILLRRQVT